MSYYHQVMYRVLAGAAVVVLSSVARAGPVLYVDDDAPPAGDGLSWATAYRFLQDAVVAADNDAGINEIRVAQGLYTPDRDEAHPDGASDCYIPDGGTGCNDPDCEATVCRKLPFCCDREWDVDCAAAASRLCVDPRLATFRLVNGVELLGGYAGIGEPNPDDRNVALYETFLSGDVTGNDGPGPFDNNGENSYHVVIGSGTDQTAVIDGFTISGGNADGLDPDNRGGGMLNLTGSPTVTDCHFNANVAGAGGGMHNRFLSNPTIRDCTFSDNVAAGSGGAGAGGGMGNHDSSPIITNCTFSSNMTVVEAGGGMANVNGSSPNITHCTFNNNTSALSGGGMFNNASIPTITACTFDSNYAQRRGGGMHNGSGSIPIITNCTFTGNTAATFGGGGMVNRNSSPMVTNCTFIANQAGGSGGGVGSVLDSFPTITNCTFSGNTAPSGGAIDTNDTLGGHSETTVCNTIVWGNSPDQIGNRAGATTTVDYSDVQGGWSGAGANNIDADPMFVGAANGDYHLLPSSPCIDAADNTCVAGITTDLDGNTRFLDDPYVTDTGCCGPPIVDMGAYELCVWDCGGDHDGNVGIVDFLALLAQWQQVGTSCDFVLGAPGVGIEEFLALLANWGPCL